MEIADCMYCPVDIMLYSSLDKKFHTNLRDIFTHYFLKVHKSFIHSIFGANKKKTQPGKKTAFSFIHSNFSKKFTKTHSFGDAPTIFNQWIFMYRIYMIWWIFSIIMIIIQIIGLKTGNSFASWKIAWNQRGRNIFLMKII